MSRSYKKHPYITDGSPGTTKEKKRYANKKVRNADDIPNGKAYRKFYESYDIHDWIMRWTWEEAKANWEDEDNFSLKERYPTIERFYRYWLKCCKNK